MKNRFWHLLTLLIIAMFVIAGCDIFIVEEDRNDNPVVPGNPFPANQSIDLPVDARLSWHCSDPDGDFITYKVYFGVINPPSLYVDGITTEYIMNIPLSYAQTYYWRILAEDGNGGSTWGPIWQFTTTIGLQVMSAYNESLSEDYYAYSDHIWSGSSGYFYIDFNLRDWPGDYGLELFLMEEVEFLNYEANRSFSVIWRQTIDNVGNYYLETPNIFSDNYYRIVIDNTDDGWEETDWDGWDDAALYDIVVYFRE